MNVCAVVGKVQTVTAALQKIGTGDGNRTHVSSLGSLRPTIERRPHEVMRKDAYLVLEKVSILFYWRKGYKKIKIPFDFST